MAKLTRPMGPDPVNTDEVPSTTSNLVECPTICVDEDVDDEDQGLVNGRKRFETYFFIFTGDTSPTSQFFGGGISFNLDTCHQYARQKFKKATGNTRRILGGLGSSPPRCMSKCGRCTPCRPVHVAVPPGTPVTAEYYPEAWRWNGPRNGLLYRLNGLLSFLRYTLENTNGGLLPSTLLVSSILSGDKVLT
ncbi:hypothetical protein RND71_018941 [Anisodus tanguticus]|uniref:Epidermal patterning factor-like protein n=1 Tax=Anisodus tanguticus TaxID=243964 RepID=A0AAE1VKP4_9SOLA|nr:hypothetical protein RND71_018941 [Anisodus tanguticus]